jgi:TfoX/Sxy family transcriptional regulator of competence genes
MAWKKASPELNELLEEAMYGYNADCRMMFGSHTFFVNNNMFAGVHEDMVILRLSEKDREEAFSTLDEVKSFVPFDGRVMKEYAAFPDSVCQDHAIFRD